MKSSLVALASVLTLVGAICGCAADAPAGESDEQNLTGDDASLSGDELAFETFLYRRSHGSEKTARYWSGGKVGADKVTVTSTLKLERDHSFHLYYAETVGWDTVHASKSFRGKWHVEGDTLHLGDTVTGRVGKTKDTSSELENAPDRDALFLTLPKDAVGEGLENELPHVIWTESTNATGTGG